MTLLAQKIMYMLDDEDLIYGNEPCYQCTLEMPSLRSFDDDGCPFEDSPNCPICRLMDQSEAMAKILLDSNIFKDIPGMVEYWSKEVDVYGKKIPHNERI
jgi:hypothetical protein